MLTIIFQKRNKSGLPFFSFPQHKIYRYFRMAHFFPWYVLLLVTEKNTLLLHKINQMAY